MLVTIKAIIEVLNGVETQLKDKLKECSMKSMPNEVELVYNALNDVQDAISNLLRLG